MRKMGTSREYKSGTNWCLWRWTQVDSDYILRLHLLKAPGFAICLHWINHPDPEPFLHDHPVSFLSIILRGWYGEITEERTYPYTHVHDWFNWVPAHKRHTITQVSPGGALTLAFMGPKVQEWGFWIDGLKVFWKDYYRRKRAQRIILENRFNDTINLVDPPHA